MNLGLGLNIAVIMGIVSITETVKRLDKKSVLKRFYVYLPLVLAAIASIFVTAPFEWHTFGINLIVYVGISAYGYDFFKHTLDNLMKKE